MTLAELSVSLAIVATLMVATGSVMVLTGRAVAITAAQASDARVDDVVATMASEQRMALTVTEHTATALTFTVADRDGDLVPETIRYSYSPDSHQVFKQVNGGAVVPVLSDVQQFRFTSVPHTEAAAAPAADVESTSDDLVYSHDGATGSNYGLSSLNWAAESFVGTLLPNNATSWRVTQVEIMGLRAVGASGSFSVSICPVDSKGWPNTLAAVEKVTVSASTLPTSLGWSGTIKFTNVDQKLNPKDRYCIVVTQSLLTATGSISIESSSTDANGVALKSSTGGGLWTIPSNQDLRIRVKGRYKYPGS